MEGRLGKFSGRRKPLESATENNRRAERQGKGENVW